MTLEIPELSLVLLVGPSGAGKSTFAARHFRPTEVLSSDFFRAMIADHDTDQGASAGAFELLHLAASHRLAGGRLTVVDATNVRPEARRPLLDLARRFHVAAVAVVLDVPPDVCHERNQGRPDRTFGPHVTRGHADRLKQSLDRLEEEGFKRVFVLDSPEAVAAAVFVRVPLPVNKTAVGGPFDIVGDVHGCLEELLALLAKLGWELTPGADDDGRPRWSASHPGGRTLVFVGDLGDRGPDTPGVLRLVMDAAARGVALCVAGNHDDKLLRLLKGNQVKLAHGLQQTVDQMAAEPPGFGDRVRAFLEGLPSHLVLDARRLVVAHAGLPADLHGRVGGRVKAFTLYGDTTGETDEFGLPVRRDWGAAYRGRAAVVYGHTPVQLPAWENRTANVDTGCVFGGSLTAVRWPEGEFVSVPAARAYAESKRVPWAGGQGPPVGYNDACQPGEPPA